jgi:hypothetical protein
MVLVERDGKAHSRVIADVTGDTLKGAIREMVDKSATICTDELSSYNGIGQDFAGGHQTVNHGMGQYVGPNGEHQHRRKLLRVAQAGHGRSLPPCQQEAFAPVLR